MAGVHPVDVTAQGVDLAVMGEEMVGVGTIPAGKSVGGKTGMHQGNRAFHGGVAQFRIILINLHRHEHAFVDDGTGGKAAYVPVIVNSGAPDLVGCPLIDNIKLAIECLLICAAKRTFEEHLPHHRLPFPGGISKGGVVGGNISPAKQLYTLFDQDLLQYMAGSVALGRFRRGKDHSDTVMKWLGKFNSERCADRTEKAVRHLHENTCAVSGIRLTAAGASMIKID